MNNTTAKQWISRTLLQLIWRLHVVNRISQYWYCHLMTYVFLASIWYAHITKTYHRSILYPCNIGARYTTGHITKIDFTFRWQTSTFKWYRWIQVKEVSHFNKHAEWSNAIQLTKHRCQFGAESHPRWHEGLPRLSCFYSSRLLFQISLLLRLIETARDYADRQTWTEMQSCATLISVSNLVQQGFIHLSCLIVQKHFAYFNILLS